MVKWVLITLYFIIFSGCAISSSEIITKQPDWVLNPTKDGFNGAVGSARAHINGLSSQREMAINRAVDILARSKNVTVSNILQTKSNINENGVQNSSMDIFSVHTVSGVNLSVEVKELWEDKNTGELYVWVILK